MYHIVPSKPELMPIGGSVEYRIRSNLNGEVSVKWRKIHRNSDVDVMILCDNRAHQEHFRGFKTEVETGRKFKFTIRYMMFYEGSEVEFEYFKMTDELDEFEVIPEQYKEI